MTRSKYGDDEDLPVRYNMWGEPITNTPKGSNPYVYQILDIFRTTKILQNELTYKVFDLHKVTEDDSVIPSSVRNYYKEGDFTVKLNPHQKSELARLVGEERAKRASVVLKNYSRDTKNVNAVVERTSYFSQRTRGASQQDCRGSWCF